MPVTFRYEKSDKILKILPNFEKFTSVINNHRKITIPTNILHHLQERADFYDLLGNSEIVLQIVGIRLPPNEWYKIETKTINNVKPKED